MLHSICCNLTAYISATVCKLLPVQHKYLCRERHPLKRSPIAQWNRNLFESFVKKDAQGCWIWQRTRTQAGYGVLTHKKRKWLAHRFACLLYGKCSLAKLERKVVLHACDRGHEGCVNPRHLNIGTQWDNVQDTRLRKRFKHSKQIDQHPFIQNGGLEKLCQPHTTVLQKRGGQPKITTTFLTFFIQANPPFYLQQIISAKSSSVINDLSNHHRPPCKKCVGHLLANKTSNG